MNVQARLDQLKDMLESAKYEARNNPVRIANEFAEVRDDLERIIATLECIQTIKSEQAE